MKPPLPSVVAGVVVAVLLLLGVRQLRQEARIDALQAQLQALQTPEPERARAAHSPQAPTGAGDAQRPSTPLAPAVPQAQAPGAAPAAPPARANVSQAELDQLEHSVLSLLDSDRPALQRKLGEVVQAQREALELEEQEQRRERWITRAEARLLELSSRVELSEDQRQAILQIQLANRDQIADMLRGAQTPEAYAQARKDAKLIRKDLDRRLGEVLGAAKLEAYKAARRDDDDDDRPAAAPSRTPRGAQGP